MITGHQALREVCGVLGGLLGIDEGMFGTRSWDEYVVGGGVLPRVLDGRGVDLSGRGRVFRPDMVVEGAGKRFVVKWRGSSDTAQILLAVRQLARDWATGTVPLLVVPYMGATGKDLCAADGVSWMDLSGNANIQGPGLVVRVEGLANRYPRRGRPSSVFAAKSARVTRALLLDVGRVFRQKMLVDETGLNAGFVSRIVRQLEQTGLISIREREIRVEAPVGLLNAWQEEYEFGKHQIVYGHVPALSGETLFVKTAEVLRDAGVEYMATGHGAARLLAGHSDFQQVAYYLSEYPEQYLLDRLQFKEVAAGSNIDGVESNIWLVIANDDGVYQGRVDVDGIWCASGVQTFLDLGAMTGEREKGRELVWRMCLDWS